MTPQEIFDKALVGVLKQGKPAMKNGSCVYYKELDGTMCAVGLLLGKDIAREWTDSHVGAVGNWESHGDVTIPEWVKEHDHLLGDIQYAHDAESDQPLEYWKNFFIAQMKRIAISHELEYKEELERV